MKIFELRRQLEKYIDKGYGNKEIVLSTSGDFDYTIDSAQQNNHASKEPEYVLIMADTAMQ